MSCHCIGAGMNNVIELILEMYDSKELNMDSTKKIIKRVVKNVHYCDGNEGEATECFVYCRCGKCLKTDKEVPKVYDLWGYEEIVAPMLCPNCLDEVFGKFHNDETYGPKIRKFKDDYDDQI